MKQVHVAVAAVVSGAGMGFSPGAEQMGGVDSGPHSTGKIHIEYMRIPCTYTHIHIYIMTDISIYIIIRIYIFRYRYRYRYRYMNINK